jgi:hypothetical protein
MKRHLALAGAILCGLAGATPARADGQAFATNEAEIGDQLELTSFVRSAVHGGRHFNANGLNLSIPIGQRWALELAPRLAEVGGGGSGGGGRATGQGDTEIAVKYLVVTETDAWPAIALEPNLTVPTGGRRGGGQVAIQISLLTAKTFGAWRLSGQFGYERQGSKTGDDHAPVSLLVERTVTKRLSLGAELVHDQPMRRHDRGSTEINVGGGWAIYDGLVLQAAVGRRLATPDESADFHSSFTLAVAF